MQTNFTAAQLADPHTKEADGILRTCVHCGFCLSGCPTYAVLADERDSPRGRIYLIKDMLESGAAPRETQVKHIDRCLTCLGCLTACPSGVDYMHLVDQARVHIEQNYARPMPERLLRRLLSLVLPRPALFRMSVQASMPFRRLAFLLPGRLKRMVETAPKHLDAPSPVNKPQVFPAVGARKKRVALLAGCVQTVLGTRITESTVRVLRRHGCEVVVARGAGCCGAVDQHMGREDAARQWARANIEAWLRADAESSLDAVVMNASGCGTTVKDYGHLFQHEPQLAEAAKRISALTRDVTELLTELGVHRATQAPNGVTVVYHDSCSLQHGQRITREPRALLANAGYAVRDPLEGHLCCGAAGTYNILQPEISDKLGRRKADRLDATKADIMACANMGCMLHIARFTDLPLVHTVELLDWATGGPKPASLASRAPVR